ncbi:hypothetical protein BRC97_10650 [Halobacteriales archaeon QS_6_71_20]|nr:MAG: hypothetical protein BRC97_10650 [Halobacteriales archaeon QS_6_71_20]
MDATRRAVLAGAGAAAAGGLAGCSSAGADGNGDAAGSGDDARLAYIRLVNRHESAHTVHLLVHRGGEPVHWSSHGLDGGTDAVTVDRSWTDEPGAFSLFVRLDDAAEWSEFAVGDGSVDCYGVETRIREDGRTEALFSKEPDECAADGTAADSA